MLPSQFKQQKYLKKKKIQKWTLNIIVVFIFEDENISENYSATWAHPAVNLILFMWIDVIVLYTCPET